MSEVNINIWGDPQYWQDAGTIPYDIDTELRLQYTGTNEGNSLHDNSRVWNMINNTPLDNTLSYCGLGTESPLSHITFYCGSYGYPIGYGNDYTYEQMCKTVTSRDDRTVTNFAFNHLQYRTDQIRYAANDTNTQFDSLHQRWMPDSLLTSNTYGYAYDAQMLGRVPVHNMLLIPYVVAIDNVNTDAPAVTRMDLKSYCDTGYTTYPYVISVFIRIATSSDTENYESHIRNDYSALNGISIYGESNMVSETNADRVTPPEKTGPVHDYFYIYSNETYEIPIMGLITGIGHNAAEVKCNYAMSFTYTEDWDLMTLTPAQISVIAWAGEISPYEYWYNSNTGQYASNHSAHYLSIWIGSSISITDFKDSVLEAVACFGLFFVESEDDRNAALDDDAVMLGILENGIGHGKYTHGSANREQPQWDMSDMHELDYDPSDPPPIDPNVYDGEMTTGDLSWYNSATVRYVLYSSQVEELTSKLWDCLALLPAGDPLSDYAMNTFLTSNPIDCIVGLKYFPVNSALLPENTSQYVSVKLGKYDTEIDTYIAKTAFRYDCGTVTIFPRFGEGHANWLDKLTSMTLYLPFCGTLKLDPEIYMGRDVNVEYAFDLITGACTAFVSVIADSGRKCITDTASGICCIDVPVTGLQQATLESQLFNAAENLKGLRVNGAIQSMTSLLGVIKSGASQDLTGTLASIGNAGSNIYNLFHNEEVAQYNLEHTQIPMKMIGTSSAATGAMCNINPVIIIERPVLPVNDFNETSYASTVGYACCRSDLVGSFTGYTEFASVVLDGFAATAAEKTLILNALKSGVILP